MSNENKESLEKLLVFISDICEREGHEWFKKKLLSTIINTNNDFLNEEIFSNTETIKKYLSISPELSINYVFIEHKILRNRLELDNLRMENVRLDLQEKDEIKRFYDFSIYAFYQIENLINFYYHTKYKGIDILLNHLESIKDSRFKRSGKENNVSDINIATKIYSFGRTYFNSPDDYTGSTINSLRLIRNEGLHRCTIIMKQKNDENKKIYNFIKFSTFNSIHRTVEILTKTIETNL